MNKYRKIYFLLLCLFIYLFLYIYLYTLLVIKNCVKNFFLLCFVHPEIAIEWRKITAQVQWSREAI